MNIQLLSEKTMVHFHLSAVLGYGVSEVDVLRCFGGFCKVEGKDCCSLTL